MEIKKADNDFTKDIKINILKGKINVKFVTFTQEEEGVVSSYLPGFDLFFSSPNSEVAAQRSEAMIHNFFIFWIKKQGWKKFIIKIHTLGFRTKMHNLTMKNLLNQRPTKAGFEPQEIGDISRYFPNAKNIKRSIMDVELAS